VGAGDEPVLLDLLHANEKAEVLHIPLVSTASVGVSDVGEPGDLGGELSQTLKLGLGQKAQFERVMGRGKVGH